MPASQTNALFCCRRVRGEKEVGSKGTREVGNVDPDKEISFQFVANELDAGGEEKWFVTTDRMKVPGL